MSDNIIELADGRDVPRAAVDALGEFEKVWPGATFPMARAGIVAAVIEALGLTQEWQAVIHTVFPDGGSRSGTGPR